VSPSWQECPATGFDPIDAEHEELVDALRAVVSAVEADDAERTREASHEFLRRMGAHFAHEERLMRETAYPRFAQHKEAHDLYLADLASYARQVAERGLTADFRRWSTGWGAEWFRFHVWANDVALGTFLVGKQRTAMSPER
jgi:hemerythrin